MYLFYYQDILYSSYIKSYLSYYKNSTSYLYPYLHRFYEIICKKITSFLYYLNKLYYVENQYYQ